MKARFFLFASFLFFSACLPLYGGDIGIPSTNMYESLAHIAPNLGIKSVIISIGDPLAVESPPITNSYVFNNETAEKQIEHYRASNDFIEMSFDKDKNVLISWDKKLGDTPKGMLNAKPIIKKNPVISNGAVVKRKKYIKGKVVETEVTRKELFLQGTDCRLLIYGDDKETHAEESIAFEEISTPPPNKSLTVHDLINNAFVKFPQYNVCVIILPSSDLSDDGSGKPAFVKISFRTTSLLDIDENSLKMDEILRVYYENEPGVLRWGGREPRMLEYDGNYLNKYLSCFCFEKLIALLDKNNFWKKSSNEWIGVNMAEAIFSEKNIKTAEYFLQVLPSLEHSGKFEYYRVYIPSILDFDGGLKDKINELLQKDDIFSFAYNTKFWDSCKAIWKGDDRPDGCDCWKDFKIPEKELIKNETIKVNDRITVDLTFYKYMTPFAISGSPLKTMKDVNYTSPEKTLLSYLSAKNLEWKTDAVDQHSRKSMNSYYQTCAYSDWLSWDKGFVMEVPFFVSLKYEDKEYDILIIKIQPGNDAFGGSFGIEKNIMESFVFVKEDSLWKYQSVMKNDIFLIKDYLDKNISNILSQSNTNEPK